jgi:hypothetical protein
LRPPGDVNDDGKVTAEDAIFIVNHVFKGGPEPVPAAMGDVDASCTITAGDIVYIVNYIFKGGATPLDGCVP